MAESNEPAASADSTAGPDDDPAGQSSRSREQNQNQSQSGPEEAQTSLTEGDEVTDNRYQVSHEEAIESDEFLYGKVFSTAGKPSDADEGQIRLDYDDPDQEFIVVIMEDARVDVRKEVSTRVVFPRGGSKAENSLLG